MRQAFIFLLLISTSCIAQINEEADRKISYYLDRIKYWDENELNDDTDSLSIYNDELFSFMTDFLNSNPSSIKANFEISRSKNLHILTSEDGNFRIYCWNTQQGRTMQFFRTIFQFSNSGRVAILPIATSEQDDNGSFSYDLNQVPINDKNHYIISSVSIGSSAVYYYNIEIKTINNQLQLVDSPLIKDKSKMKSDIGYEIDLANNANRDNSEARDNMQLKYDKEKKLIILPYINDNDKVTEEKIIYRFNGKYFVRK